MADIPRQPRALLRPAADRAQGATECNGTAEIDADLSPIIADRRRVDLIGYSPAERLSGRSTLIGDAKFRPRLRDDDFVALNDNLKLSDTRHEGYSFLLSLEVTASWPSRQWT